MALMLFAALVSVAIPQEAKVPPPQAEPFTFRTWQVGSPYKEDDPRLKYCKVVGSGPVCVLSDSKFAGIEVEQMGVVFGRSGLIALSAKFTKDQGEIISAALRTRYGRPCVERIEHPRNRVGERFDSKVLVWCFRDGRGTYRSIDGNVEVSTFVFEATDFARQHAAQDF